MSATLPTDGRDWARIEAGYRAVDALQQIIRELLDGIDVAGHDPEAPAILASNVATVLGEAGQ
ncbi:hypothetical protein [Raineyella sp. W15-4]|uniref:hypothetical protein n=1 Tax=Raineyella sp. W15-4 TaxID=3081651 RepID=UPI002954856D|nr:hypothetical protein [Raineyella sp. W15-4]WOQ15627.1 hypothetical protein R0145_10285 [Raineyella sp. W15-4]